MAIFNSYVSHYQRVYHDIISVTWIFFQFPPTRSWYGHRTTKKAVTKLPAVPKRWHGVDVKHIILPKLRTLLWSIVHPYLTYVYLMLKPCLRPNTLAGEVAGKCFTLVCRCCSKQAPSWGHCWFFQLLEEHPCLIALTKWLHNVASLPGQIGRLRRKHVQPFGARNNIIQNDPNKNCLSNHHLTIIQPPIVSILSIISMWYDVGTTIINHPPVITIFFSVVCLRANPSVCPRRRRQHVRTSKSTVFCGTKCTCPWSWLSSCKAQLSYLCVECYNNITINIIIIIIIIIIITIIIIIIITIIIIIIIIIIVVIIIIIIIMM